MSLEAALAAAEAGRDKALADLVEELAIPSVSTLPEHRDDCRRNADWLIERLTHLGFECGLHDMLEGGHPVLRADWMQRDGAPTLTIYGHYDVQPPEPYELWDSPPFEARIEDGVLFARGCADNKGNHMASLKAVEAWMSVGGPPCNVRFLIEGEEEIGGESLPAYVRANASTLQTGGVVIWDGGFSSDSHPSLVVGLRGLLYTDVIVRGSARDLHSGGFGGVAPNACDALAWMLAQLHDDNRAVTVPGFYDNVRAPSESEMARWHRDPDGEVRFKELMGTDVVGEPGYSIEERLWTRPTLEVNGFIGGFTGHGAKTVIPAEASAKVSMRLVPGQDPDVILDAFTKHLKSIAPPGTTVEVIAHTGTPAVECDVDNPVAQAAMASWQEAMGRECVLLRTGGSVPVTVAFAEALGADVPILVSGVASKDSAAHAPNERLYLENYYGGIDMMVRFLDSFAKAAS